MRALLAALRGVSIALLHGSAVWAH
jgi:hypothetical protein